MPIFTRKQANEPVAQFDPVKLGEEWTPCVKLPLIVHVRKQREGELHVSTREGLTPMLSDDLIMRGISGEEYPICREIFEKTYTLNTTPPTVQAAVEAAYLKAAEVCENMALYTGVDCADSIRALSGTKALREFGVEAILFAGQEWGLNFDPKYASDIVDRVIKGDTN